MRVLVCGGRNYTKAEHETWVLRELDRLAIGWPTTPPDEYGNSLPAVCIIAGGARGIDTHAATWAIVNWTEYKEFPADWKKYGNSAGPIRNQQMLDEGKPDLVVAFPGGKGTANMVKLAEEAGVKVIRIDSESKALSS